MKKVYLLFDGNGEYLIDIYSSVELAEKRRKKIINKVLKMYRKYYKEMVKKFGKELLEYDKNRTKFTNKQTSPFDWIIHQRSHAILDYLNNINYLECFKNNKIDEFDPCIGFSAPEEEIPKIIKRVIK